MDDLHPSICAAPIGAVSASGVLFAIRGLGLNTFGARSIRSLAVGIGRRRVDTAPLPAALMPTTIVEHPFADAWLTTAVLVAAAYLGLARWR